MAGGRAKKKAKGPAKPKKPTCLHMCFKAIKAIRQGGSKGKSRAAIYNWIGENFAGTSQAAVRRALVKGIADGSLVHGVTNQRFKLTDKAREAMKPKPKKKKAKKRPAKRRPKKKKATRKRTAKRRTAKRKPAKSKSKKRVAKRRTAKRRPAKRSAAKKRTAKRRTAKRRAAKRRPAKRKAATK